jgi:ribosomal protein L11 methyltransferase
MASSGCIWRKAASAAWLAQHSTRLDEQTRGSYAVIERPNGKRVQVEAFCDARREARKLVAEFGGTVADLSSGWQARFFSAAKTKPIRAGDRLIVASDAADLPKEGGAARTLIIPASAAFGTGEHATTAMSLRMLERVSRRLRPGWRMLDAGTGSGILAVAAACFGAAEVIAIDNDPLAISVAQENARANGIRGVTFITGDVNGRLAGKFDIIAANLFSELLIAMLPKWRKSLAAGGRLILSGVLRNQEPDLARALRRNGCEALEIRRRGKWIALLAAREKPS